MLSQIEVLILVVMDDALVHFLIAIATGPYQS